MLTNQYAVEMVLSGDGVLHSCMTFQVGRHLCRSTTHNLKFRRREQLRWNAANGYIAGVIAQGHRDLVPPQERRSSGKNDKAAFRFREGEVSGPDEKRQADRCTIDDVDGGIQI